MEDKEYFQNDTYDRQFLCKKFFWVNFELDLFDTSGKT